MNELHRVISYLKYRYHAVGKHAIHSPFVFDLINSLHENKSKPKEFEAANLLRKALYNSKELISKNDLGAGNQRSILVSELAKTSSISKQYGGILSQLVKAFNAKKILELGTCLGLSAMYLNLGNLAAEVWAIEGDEQTFLARKKYFSDLKLEHYPINFINSTFENHLAHLPENQKFDLIFIDGNHTLEATLRYYEVLKKHIHSQSAIVLDDIYWSKEMTQAWHILKAKEEVSLSLDLYQLGVLAFRNQEKEHFVLKTPKKYWIM